MLLLLSLATFSAAADKDPFIDLIQQAKRSLANGRWGLRPGKRSANTEILLSTGDGLACDGRSTDLIQMELVHLMDKVLLYASHLRNCKESSMTALLTEMDDSDDA
uniref:Uncharacterized protein n=1 Tax=Plectus sambesii TaxID=2011161 RepID=A0A914XLJ6_9BILA